MKISGSLCKNSVNQNCVDLLLNNDSLCRNSFLECSQIQNNECQNDNFDCKIIQNF